MRKIDNIKLNGKYGKPVLLDVYYKENGKEKPVVVFAHGFKGFKDWGHWALIGKQFAEAGFVFIKFNFSHNGTTPDKPTAFADLEAFGHNNYNKELADIRQVLDWVIEHPDIPDHEINTDATSIIGHSRGGAIAILEANRNPNVKQLITWASVQSLNYAWTSEQQLAKWKEKGVYYILNGRTYQEMPLYYQLYEDFLANKETLNVEVATRNLDKPFLILHGENDPAVPIKAAFKLKEWAPNASIELLENANHVFGGKHPYDSQELPDSSKILVQKTIDFIQNNLVSPS